MLGDAPYLVLSNGKDHVVRRCLEFKDASFAIVSTKAHDVGGNIVACLVVADIEDSTMVTRAAAQMMNTWGLSGVVPTTESAVELAGLIRSTYGLPGLPYDGALLFTNKLVMKTRFSRRVRCEVPVPLGKWQRHPPPGLSSSYIQKPITGSGSRSIRRLSVDALLASPPPSDSAYVVERAVEVDQEYHFDVVIRDGVVLFAQLSRYFRPVLQSVGSYHGSTHLPSGHELHQPVSTMFQAVLEESGVQDGVFHMEVLQSRGNLLLGEIAIRPAGGGIANSLVTARGIDLWDEHFRVCMNRPSRYVGPVLTDNSAGYYGRCGLSLQLTAAQRPHVESTLLGIPGVYAVEDTGSARHDPRRAPSSVDFAFLIYFRVADSTSLERLISEVRDNFAHLYITSTPG